MATNPHPLYKALRKPACPSCGSSEKVVRMATSLTPFERPDPEDMGGHWYCQACSHDFVPDEAEDE